MEYLSKCVDIVLSYNNVFYETEANYKVHITLISVLSAKSLHE